MSAYLDTRVSLYASRLWRDEALDALVGAPEAAIAETLMQRGCRNWRRASSIRPDRQDGRSLERCIIAEVLDETRVLIRPLSGDARSFLTFWTARFEISNVKTLLRSKMTGERPAAVLARLTPMGAFGRLDNQDLAHAEDVNELLRRLEAGPYAGIVRHAPARLRTEPRSVQPGRCAGSRLLRRPDPARAAAGNRRGRAVPRFDGQPHRPHQPGLAAALSLQLPVAAGPGVLPADRFALQSAGARLQELAALDSLEAVLAALPPVWRTPLSDAADIPDVFARMERLAAAQARKVLRSRAPDIARAFAYLILRERDLRAVRAVLRGRHLGLAADEIRHALQRVPEGA